MNWDQPASEEILQKVKSALETNGFVVEIVATREQAKKKVLEIIPEGSEVFTNTSTTFDELGLTKAINDSGKYNALHPKTLKMDRKTQEKEMKILRVVPDYATGSVHALTEDGRLIIASRTGSQIPAEAYGANHVIFVVGSQKIVKDLESGIKRVYEHSLVMESERARKAYNIPAEHPGSQVDKILILNKEETEGRTRVILLKEVIGF